MLGPRIFRSENWAVPATTTLCGGGLVVKHLLLVLSPDRAPQAAEVMKDINQLWQAVRQD